MRIQSSRRSRIPSLRSNKDRLGTLYRDWQWRLHGKRVHALERFIFCRPRGGFNDNLAQIGRCLIYGLMHQRKLVLSTVNAGQLRDFATYFCVHPSGRQSILLNDSLRSLTHRQDIFPANLSGDLETMFPIWNLEARLHIDPVTRVPIRFENKPYPHAILLHEQCGGGPGWSTLERLQFTPPVRQAIHARLAHLPRRYTAIHIRDTEYYRTDWKAFLNAIPGDQLRRFPCLLCTDNPATIQQARQYIPSVEFLSIYPFPEGLEEGESLHYSPKAQGWDFDVGTLTDLVAMARAERLFITTHKAAGVSGFGQLALDLHRRPYLLARLMNGSR